MLIGMTEATTKMPRQRDDDRRAADDQRHARGDERAEDDRQGERRQRQRDDLAPPQVRLGDGLDVAVERRPAGQLDVEARAPAAGARAGSAARRASRPAAGRGRRCRRRCGRRPRPGAATRRCETTRATCGARRRRRAIAAAAAASNAGVPGLERRAARRRRRAPTAATPELGLEERLGPGRFEVVEDEPAGAELARGPAARTGARPGAGRPTRRRPTTRDARRSGRGARRGSRLGFASDSTTDEERDSSYPRRLGDHFRRVGLLLASARAALPGRLPAADPVRDLGGHRHPDDLHHPALGDDRRGRLDAGSARSRTRTRSSCSRSCSSAGRSSSGSASSSCPHTGANSPYGGIGLIALFSGFFIMMGFLWAVIGE